MNKLVLIVLVFNLNTIAQVSEFGFFAGSGYFIGDLNKSHFSQQDLSLGAIYKTDFRNERMSLRFN